MYRVHYLCNVRECSWLAFKRGSVSETKKLVPDRDSHVASKSITESLKGWSYGSWHCEKYLRSCLAFWQTFHYSSNWIIITSNTRLCAQIRCRTSFFFMKDDIIKNLAISFVARETKKLFTRDQRTLTNYSLVIRDLRTFFYTFWHSSVRYRDLIPDY